jgi:multiple sugar transport system permease protein
MTEASAAVNGNYNGGAGASPDRTMAASRKPPLRKRRRFRVSIVPYLFLAPFLLLFAAFLVAPLVYALYTSVFRDTLVGGRQFVGFANYLRVAVDSNFWGGVSNLLFFGATQVPIMLGLALTLGIVLDRGALHARGLFRLGFFIPYAVPSVVAALVWGYIYGPAFGPFSQLARGLGLPPPDFLSNRTMLFSLANIVTWEFTGYNMVIYYAALKAIPPDLREAAVMDGAGAWQYALFVQLPMLWPAILLTIIFSINGTLQLFNEPYLMRSIAPAVINTHYTPNIYAYFLSAANQQYNYAAAVSFVLGLLIAVIAGAFTLATRRAAEARQ